MWGRKKRRDNQGQILGEKGELIARKFLQRKGYRIKETNFHTPLGELDIVAEQGNTLVFVEVKARTSETFGLPQEAVSGRKQRKLRMMAESYLKVKGLNGVNCRFDVVSILFKPEEKTEKIELITDAF